MRPGHPPRAPASHILQGLAIAQCLALTVLVITAALMDDALSWWGWQANLVVVAVLWWTLRLRTQAVADRSAAGLDERELAIRNYVGWWGYATATAGGTATGLVLIIAVRVQSVDDHALLDRAGTTLIALMLLAAVVPTTILAATAPPDNGPEEMGGV